MKRSTLRLAAILFGAACMLAAGIAEAQWVFLARRAIGRVEQMSQSQGETSYDSAAVILDAPVDKVFAAVLKGLKNRTDLTITKEDPAQRLIQFTNGKQIAGIKLSSLGDDLTHMLVSSAHSGMQQNAAMLVSESVLRVCKEMNVECSQAQQ
jgi:hypothetical protein